MNLIAHLAACSLVAVPQLLCAQTADNGTDPTKLRRMVAASYESMDLGTNASRGTFKLILDTPVADRTALRFTVPVAAYDAAGLDNDYARGDISLRVTHIVDVTRLRGIVLQGEIIGDTAGRRELGYSTTVLKGTAIYARFLPGGAIFAPAISHAQSIDDHDQVSETTADFYFVPHLADPAWYSTIDPAVIRNWEGNTTYASVALTVGRAVGQIGGGIAQVYVKPNVFVGADRPADWAIEAGFRVIGF